MEFFHVGPRFFDLFSDAMPAHAACAEYDFFDFLSVYLLCVRVLR